MNQTTDTSAVSLLACDDGFDPIEDRLRANIRSTIEAVFNEGWTAFSAAFAIAERPGRRRDIATATGTAPDHGDIRCRDDQRPARPR